MAAWCAENLRDCEGWRSCGLPLSTPSNECCRLFDGVLRQVVSWSDCSQLGGIHVTMEKMLAADSKAVLPRAFRLGLEGMGMGTCARVNPVFMDELEKLQKDAVEYGTEREQKHAKAVKQWAEGEMRAAANTWEEILSEFPTDLMACKFAHEAYFFMGDCWSKRDSVGRVIGKYKGTEPCYSYLHGMLAFGLEECGEYRKAEKEAQQALSLNRFDSWATHANAHVMEMEGRQDDGIHFMESTVNDWKPGWMIATHNFWHNALFYIEKMEYEVPLSIFDQEILPRLTKSGSMLDMVDAVSLLWRLEMEGVNIGNRWSMLPAMQKHIDDHVIVFNDVHFGPMLLRMENYSDEIKLHNSLVNFSRYCSGDNARVSRLVGLSLYEGMIHYGKGNFDEAASKLLPIRNDIHTIGGSNAQRDVFTQTLIHSCIMSKDPEHWKMTPTVLEERAILKPNSPLAQRLLAKFTKHHIN